MCVGAMETGESSWSLGVVLIRGGEVKVWSVRL